MTTSTRRPLPAARTTGPKPTGAGRRVRRPQSARARRVLVVASLSHVLSSVRAPAPAGAVDPYALSPSASHGVARTHADDPQTTRFLTPEGLAGRRPRETRLEAQDRLGVKLGDAGLGHAEHLADLAQGQLLVVVERHDELLALGQTGDRLAQGLLQLGRGQLGLRLRAGRVLDRVDQGDLVSPAAGRDRPELVERRDRRAADLGEAVVELVGRHSELLGDLFVCGRPHQLALELADRSLDVAGAAANAAGNPVHRAELVDDRALDPRDRVGLELDVAVGVEALDRADQAEQAVRDEVVLVHVCRQAATEPARDVLDERRVGQDQAVADALILALAVLAPELLRLVLAHA